jgi:hypothetical protein
MLNRRQYLARRAVSIVLFTAGMSSFPLASATAQDHQQPSPVISIVKEVVLDPTTYAPAVIAYDATRRDWDTSQPFFRSGFMEMNPRFTISGLPNDVPVSYADGTRRILSDAVANMGLSLVNNLTDRAFERMLMERYPGHRKIVRAVGWIERLTFSGYMSYVLSAQHYRQAAANASRAGQLGLR